MGSAFQAFNASDQVCLTSSTASTCGSSPAGATSYTYDTRGNRIKAGPAVGTATTLTYDQANRLSSYSQVASTSYAYNGEGLLTSKTTGSSSSAFVWDVTGSLPLLVRDGPSSAYVYCIYGPGGLPIEQVAGSSVLLYVHDQLGSTRAVTDTSGVVKAAYSYDAYGNLASSSGSVANPFRFAGQYTDPESGLHLIDVNGEPEWPYTSRTWRILRNGFPPPGQSTSCAQFLLPHSADGAS